MQPLSLDEVIVVIKEIPTNKGSWLDGFIDDFFHSCWDIIQHKFWEPVQEYRMRSTLIPSVNTTFLTLVPKEEN